MSSTKLREKVNSILELRALINIPDGKIIETDSYYGDGKGGGNTFRKVPDTGQADNGGTIIRGTVSGVYEAINQTEATLEQFGVVNTIVDEITTMSTLGITIIASNKEYEITQENTGVNLTMVCDNSVFNSTTLSLPYSNAYQLLTFSGDVKIEGKVTFDGKWDNSTLDAFTGTEPKFIQFIGTSTYLEDITVQNTASYGIDVSYKTHIDKIRVIDTGYNGLRYLAKTDDSIFINDLYGKTTTTGANARNTAFTVNGQSYIKSIHINKFTGDNAVILTEADGGSQDETPYYRHVSIGSYSSTANKLSTGVPTMGKFNNTSMVSIGTMFIDQQVYGDGFWFTEVESLDIGSLHTIGGRIRIEGCVANIGTFDYTQGTTSLDNTGMIQVKDSKVNVGNISYTLSTNYSGVNTAGIFQLENSSTDTTTYIEVGDVLNNSLSGEKIGIYRAGNYSRDTVSLSKQGIYQQVSSTFYASISIIKKQWILYQSSSVSANTSFYAGDTIYFTNDGTYSGWHCESAGTISTGGWIKYKKFTGIVEVDWGQIAKTSVPTEATGTVLDLSNPSGYPYNMDDIDTKNYTAYTTTNLVVMGNAICRINSLTQPTVDGSSSPISGATFIPSTDMYMVVQSLDGNSVEFYFLEI